jgi:cephalosporin-C deacetylase-like acetyl esterase
MGEDDINSTLIALQLIVSAAWLQPAAEPDPATAAGRHACVVRHLQRTAAELSARCLAGPLTLHQWSTERSEHQRQLRYMLGLEPFPERTPLNARIMGTVERDAYRIERLVFQSLPGLYVTGNLYVPRDRPGPLPAILYACGHSPHPRGAKFGYQDRVIWYARHGYVVLIVDTLEFGEVPGVHHGIHDLNMWHWLSLGYTPMGVEVWNSMRAIDYLETRPEVDKTRIGMTGISGGGSATWYTAAVDERVAAAVPVCSTITFGTQAEFWTAAGQCDCIYFHNTYLTDFPIVAALIAPRPLLICSGQRDGDFMPAGYHEVYRRAKRVYDLYAAAETAPQRIEEVDDNVGHTDAPLFRQRARQWLNQWLKADTSAVAPPESEDASLVDADALACLDALPSDAVNYHIHDTFIPTAPITAPESLAAWRARKQRIDQQLKEVVFRWFPQQPAPFLTRTTSNDGGWAAKYARYQEVLFQSEPDAWVRAQLLQPRERAREAPLLVYAKRPGDSIYFLDLDELLPLLGRYNVLIVNPRLTEHPVAAAEYAEIERTASWIGRTVAGMQLWDILRAVEWALTEGRLAPESISVYGKGDLAILGLYAGVLDKRIDRVVMNDPPTTHWQGPALLNILRVSDTPELAAAFAPRQLVFVREVPEAFRLTQTIYALHDADDKLSSARSLPEALGTSYDPAAAPTQR